MYLQYNNNMIIKILKEWEKIKPFALFLLPTRASTNTVPCSEK
jgi:hypothetical protein